MKREHARREIDSLDYYLQNHTNDYSEESHTAMTMAIEALEQPSPAEVLAAVRGEISKIEPTENFIKFKVLEIIDKHMEELTNQLTKGGLNEDSRD